MSCINQKEDNDQAVHATTNSEFLTSLRRSWDEQYQKSAFLRDIPRLVRRVHVQTRDGVLHPPSADDESKVEAIVRLLELISAGLGVEQEAVQSIRCRLERYWRAGRGDSNSVIVTPISLYILLCRDI